MRRTAHTSGLAAAWAVVAALLGSPTAGSSALAAQAPAAGAGREAAPSRPLLTFSDTTEQATLGRAYVLALHNLLDINTVAYDSATYDATALLASPPGTFIRAGGGYSQPWTRDASINSWNAASLLEPVVARNTLWAVVKRRPDGSLVVQQDNQWWDQCIWVIAAWQHYLVTGDRAFLREAWGAASNTLATRRAKSYEAAYGLFQGPGFFNDGIAGYPSPPTTQPQTSSFVLEYEGTATQMTLSTNELYYEAFRSAAHMARELGRPESEAAPLDAAADGLKASINRRFWMSAEGRYGYFIHDGDGAPPGTLDPSQEGTGQALAILFGIADSMRTRSVLEHTHEEPWGIVDVWPHFSRFDDAHPGRHNVSVWPMVQGFWADAAAESGDEAVFAREVSLLSALAVDADKGDGMFWEIYNARSGAPDGGWQTGKHWDSEKDQTWSATAYLRMIYRGLFGMRFTTTGLEFRPLLPAGWGDVRLSGVPYRDATLDVSLRGAGRHIRRCLIDGVAVSRCTVSAAAKGTHTVAITLGSD